MRRYGILLWSGILLFAACGSTKKVVTQTEAERRAEILALTNNLEQLGRLFPGVYTNTTQYQANPKDFYHVAMKLYRIWPDRDDALWFYIEQAQYEVQDQPYRQRVYKLHRGERDTLISEVYNLPDAKAAIGKGQDQEFWKELYPKQLVPREGCAVYLTRRTNAYYVGNTRPNTCSSSLAGASYAQSQVTIGLDVFKSLDQGFDEQDQQVWGSEKGAYNFERVQE